MKIIASPAHCKALLEARKITSNAAKKAERRRIFAAIRREHNIAGRFGVRNVSNVLSLNYGVLYDLATKANFDDGKVAAPVATPKPTSVIPVKQVAVPPVAKAAVKAVATPVTAKPVVVKAAIKSNDHSPVRTATHSIEVRATINGVRRRLGFASTAEARQRIIANEIANCS